MKIKRNNDGETELIRELYKDEKNEVYNLYYRDEKDKHLIHIGSIENPKSKYKGIENMLKKGSKEILESQKFDLDKLRPIAIQEKVNSYKAIIS